MKAQDLEGEVLEQAVQGRQQVGLADALAGGHQFELRDAVHGVDVIDALEAVLVALVNAVDADEAGASFGGGRRRSPMGIALPWVLVQCMRLVW